MKKNGMEEMVFFYLFHIQMIVDNPHFALPNLYMDRNNKITGIGERKKQ